MQRNVTPCACKSSLLQVVLKWPISGQNFSEQVFGNFCRFPVALYKFASFNLTNDYLVKKSCVITYTVAILVKTFTAGSFSDLEI